jgi:hypothetical protein
VILGGELNTSFLLWPLQPASGTTSTAMVGYVQKLLGEFATILASPEGVVYLVIEGTLLLVALTVWVLDGTPGLPWGRPHQERGRR